jgi:hypothetical protein
MMAYETKDNGMEASHLRMALRGAGLTVLSLFGGLLLGVVVGNVVFSVLPGHSVTNPNPLHILLAALPALAGFVAGSALWGVLVGRMAAAADRRRMAVSGMLGFAPITLGLGVVLQVLEPIAVERFGAQVPVHRLFTLFFVPTAFLIAGISAWAIGLGLKDRLLAWKLWWRVGLAAALGFAAVNLVMETQGWIVGGPRAAERFTMLTVLFVGNLGAALAGGAVIGIMLAHNRRAA